MRKVFTSILMIAFVLTVSAQKKVAYVTIEKAMDAQACNAAQDPIIRLLQKDANFDVTVVAIPDASKAEVLPAGTDLSTFDLVIAQEGFSSTSVIWNPGNGLALAGVGTPMIYNKMYALRDGRALLSGDAGSGTEMETETQKYVVTATSNELFTGITLDSDNGFKPFVRYSNDDGSLGDRLKTINYAKDVVISGTTLLAEPFEKADAADVVGACINDCPQGTTVGSVVLSARVIMIGMNYGAICGDADYATTDVYDVNMTSAGLTLWRNAAYILTGQTVPSTPVDVANDLASLSGSSNEIIKSNDFKVSYSGSRVMVNFGLEQDANVSVFNIAGKLVGKQMVSGSSASIDIVGQSKGIYLVKVVGSKVSGTQKFVIR